MKKIISTFLTLAMVFALFAFGGPAVLAESPSSEQADPQLSIIFATKDSFRQSGTAAAWRYAVTDLDHNGQLELIAAALHPVDRSNNLKVFELSADNSSFQECKTIVPEGESFPDILSNSADTFYDAATDTWSYLFIDHIAISDKEVFDVNCSVSLKNQSISFIQHAISHTETVGGVTSTSFIDNNGSTISPDAYNNAAVNAFANAVRSSTSFGWFRFEDLTDVSVLKDSYAVFTGEKEPDKTTSPKPTVTPTVAVPVQTQAPQATAAPRATAAPQQAQPSQKVTYLTVTKNPTNENRKVGDKALFVANATIFDSLTWTFVAPNGGEYSVANFRNSFPRVTVSGEYSTTLSVANLQSDLNGWGAYCTFYHGGQTARTSTAYIMIKDSAAPASTADTYGSASGVIYHDTAYTVYIVLQNGVTATVNGSLCNIVYGDFTDGCSCTVYYVAHANGTYDIYSVDIYGTSSYVPPASTAPQAVSFGSMSGRAYEGGGGFAITLSNGAEVYVDAYKCNVSGTFYAGCDCTVYYTTYSDGSYEVTSADIYGSQAAPDYGYTYNQYGDVYEIHEAYNADGTTYDTVTCPACGREVSMAYGECPYCGYPIW